MRYGLAIMAVLLAATLACCPRRTAPPAHVYLGVSVHQGETTTDMLHDLARYQRDAHKRAALVMYWRDWARSGRVDPAAMNAIYQQGSVPVITWGPGNWTASTHIKHTRYSLRSVLAGTWDSYIRSFAAALRAYHRPVLLRFAPEMNGPWYTWGAQPRRYVRVWRHVHALFVAAGATNVQWVWCPNVDWDGHHPVAPYYPGAAYVDWLGMDGYNKAQYGWHTFTQIFQATYHELLALHGTAPIMIGELAASEATSAQVRRGLSKAGWITSAYGREMASFPRIKAVTWFNEDKSAQEKCLCDWRIESSAAATRAFARAVAPPVYCSTWPWGTRSVLLDRTC
jgi:beta-mannanase